MYEKFNEYEFLVTIEEEGGYTKGDMLYWDLPVDGRNVMLGSSGRQEKCCTGSFRYAEEMLYWGLPVVGSDVVLAASGRRERCCTRSFR